MDERILMYFPGVLQLLSNRDPVRAEAKILKSPSNCSIVFSTAVFILVFEPKSQLSTGTEKTFKSCKLRKYP